MTRDRTRKRETDKVADIIRDAGGKVIGRTRLQKIAYFLEITGLGEGFLFAYCHFGPFSEELATAAGNAALLKVVHEEEHPTSWGGTYSVYTTPGATPALGSPAPRIALVREAAKADPIELELAATAAFLANEGTFDPWEETARRKPDKAQRGRLDSAKALYRRLQQIETPIRCRRSREV